MVFVPPHCVPKGSGMWMIKGMEARSAFRPRPPVRPLDFPAQQEIVLQEQENVPQEQDIAHPRARDRAPGARYRTDVN
eukprot:gene8693-biopygen112